MAKANAKPRVVKLVEEVVEEGCIELKLNSSEAAVLSIVLCGVGCASEEVDSILRALKKAGGDFYLRSYSEENEAYSGNITFEDKEINQRYKRAKGSFDKAINESYK